MVGRNRAERLTLASMNWLRRTGRHRNFYVAALVGALAAILTLTFAAHLFPSVAASAFSLAYLVLVAFDLPRLTPDFLRKHASEEDAPPAIIFALTLAIVIYVVVALFLIINDKKSPDVLLLILGFASVVLSWLMIGAMWAMHYAWEYYDAPTNGQDTDQRGGLGFPGDQQPDGMAFIYFSLVVAMTAQTSDTNVSDNHMRRIVIGQGIFGYFFNTVAVAAAVNVVVSLGHTTG
jgi:uncharacterized membrane protein